MSTKFAFGTNVRLSDQTMYGTAWAGEMVTYDPCYESSFDHCRHPKAGTGAFNIGELEAVPVTISIKSDTQLGKVLALTLGQGAWTLAGIASVTGASEAAISARLRDLRAAGYEVTCVKHRGDAQRSYTVRTKAIAVASDGTATPQPR